MPANSDDDSVEPLVRNTAAWAWRLLAIFAAALAFFWVVAKLEIIVVPVLLALMISALLVPVVDWLDRQGLPRGGAVALVLLGGFAVLGGILAFVVTQFIVGLPDLTEQVTRSIDTTRRWLIEGPVHLRSEQITNAGNAAIQALHNNQSKLTSGALNTAATLTELLTAAVLVLFTLIFFLYGGRNIFAYTVKIFPIGVRDRVMEAGRAGYGSLIAYVRATFLVAFTDAAGVGAGLAIMGVPLALPLASLVFLGAFIPLIGALISGLVAVVVALLTKGIVYALITLGLLVVINQIESHLLQPLVMGRAVSIHPLGVVLAISTGGVLAGIVGALLAVPTVAFLNNAIQVLLARDPAVEAEKLDEEAEGRVVLHAQADEPEQRTD
ncbi:transmembrane protein [Mycobacterium lentiflavum]|uniref:AI-2E family transporter n=1 Tax=Mycobacterium lentiflavum TaxID=141349 RepID=A0A0E4CLE8_MYCLN|nr:AI-2E family transporter [Mycobacterium lentiflavum]MEE3065896.1 AI-2E family transporter [Actinomycetota bacterium]ULP42833.1 AI-2E family transporter [Mycobacterium lentiflavum]CQD04072.1 transmembrane protein [Mycobacterium lentiflavum]